MGLTRRSAAACAKRVLDIALVLVTLPFSLPLMALVALGILWDGSGPVIHSQIRVGRGCKPFRLHKFRTLRADDAHGASIAPDGDPRITRPGRFLRRWRLDELPQLFDIVRGEMSLVGPRPERPQHLQAIPEGLQQRVYRVRPGLTGPAAVAFLAEDEYLATVTDPVDVYCRIIVPAKLRLELDYVERWSLLLDLALIVRTLFSVPSKEARRRSRRSIERLVVAAAADHSGATTPWTPDS